MAKQKKEKKEEGTTEKTTASLEKISEKSQPQKEKQESDNDSSADEETDDMLVPNTLGKKKKVPKLTLNQIKEICKENFGELGLNKEEFESVFPLYHRPTGQFYLKLKKAIMDFKEEAKKEKKEDKIIKPPVPKEHHNAIDFVVAFENYISNHPERLRSWYSTLKDTNLGKDLNHVVAENSHWKEKQFKEIKEDLVKKFIPYLSPCDLISMLCQFKRFSNWNWPFRTYLSELFDAIMLCKNFTQLESTLLMQFYIHNLPKSLKLDAEKIEKTNLNDLAKHIIILAKNNNILETPIKDLDQELEIQDPKKVIHNDWVGKVDPTESTLKKISMDVRKDFYKEKREKESYKNGKRKRKHHKEEKEASKSKKEEKKPEAKEEKKSRYKEEKKHGSKHDRKEPKRRKDEKRKGNKDDSDSDYPLQSSITKGKQGSAFKTDKTRYKKVSNRISKLEKKEIYKRLKFKKQQIAMKTFTLSDKNVDELEKTIAIQIDKKMFRGHLDSLSTKSLLNYAFIKELKKEKELKEDGTTFRTADGRIVASKYIDLHIQTLNYYANHRWYILDYLSIQPEVIIGLDLFKPLRVVINSKTREVVSSNDIKMEFLYDEIRKEKNHIMLKHEMNDKMKSRLKHLLDPNQGIKGYAKVDKINIPCKKKTINKIYSLPYALRFEIAEKIKEWKDKKIIGESKEVEHLLPLVCVKKKNGKIRICLDLRTVNIHTPYDTSQNKIIPKIHRILSEGKKYRWFASIDLTDAYLSLELDEESKDFTTFEFNRQKWRFNSVPFGLHFIPAKFQLIMEKLFVEFDFIYPYIDDLLIGGESLDDLESKLAQVIQKLNESNFKINLEKSVFASTQINVLGKVISHGKIEIDREKLIKFDFTNPRNGKGIMRVIGFANFFRDHIPLIEQLMAPLERLKNKRKLKPDELDTAAKYTQLLKKALYEAIPLGNFDIKYQTYLATDASRTGISGVLYQLIPCKTDSSSILEDSSNERGTPDDDSSTTSEASEVSSDEDQSDLRATVDDPHCSSITTEKDGVCYRKNYIGFYSKILKEHEKRYGISKLELFAGIKAITHFNEFLYGHTFTLLTDHQPLEKLFAVDNEMLTTTMKSWLDILMEYSFHIEYVKGVLHILPDKLSRLYMDMNQEYDARKTIQLRDPSKRRSLRESEWDKKHKLLVENHDLSGHWGINKTTQNIHRKGYMWKNMKTDVKNHIQKCEICRSHNFDRGFHPLESETFCYPMEQCSMDVIGPIGTSKNGYKRILCIVDSATRYIFLKPLHSKKSEEVAKALFEVFLTHGFPKNIRMDGGKEFLGEVNKIVQELIHTTKRGAAYNPQSNSEIESQVKSIFQSLRKIADDLGKKNRWDEIVPLVQWELNNKISSISQSTPFELFYGRGPVFQNENDKTPDEKKTREFWNEMYETIYPGVFESVKAKKKRIKDQYDNERKSRQREFELGDLVMLETPKRSLNEKRGKLDSIYTGPYIIIKVLESGNYSLQDAKTGSKKNLKKIPTNRIKFSSSPEEILDIKDSDTSDQKKLLVNFGNEDYWIEENTLPSELSFLIDEFYEDKERERLRKLIEGVEDSESSSESEESDSEERIQKKTRKENKDDDFIYYGYSSGSDDHDNAEWDEDYID